MADREASAPIRKLVRNVLRHHEKGYKMEALEQAMGLAGAHPHSAVAQNLAGDLHIQAAGDRLALIGRHDMVTMGHNRSAAEYFADATRLAPECLVSAVSHAQALYFSMNFDVANKEFHRALRMTYPADPADYHVVYDLHIHQSSAKVRKEKAMANALKEMDTFKALVHTKYVPGMAAQVLNAHKLGGADAAQARRIAKSLAENYKFSARAQLLQGHVEMEFTESLLASIRKTPFLERVLRMIGDASVTCPRSLVISLFLSEILTMLGEHEAAINECCRSLGLKKADDPLEQDIPPGSTIGKDYKSRVNYVKGKITILHDQIRSLVPVAMADENSNAGDVSSPPHQAIQDMEEQTENVDTRQMKKVSHQATRYGHSALHQSAIWPRRKKMIPEPPTIHMVAGKIVSHCDVNIFIQYCIASSKCPENHTVCHICFFEGVKSMPKFKDKEMFLHASTDHFKDHSRKSSDETLEQPPVGCTCEEPGCCVVARTGRDIRLHYHFVHRLPTDWWVT